jgi:hypothetical protein
MECLPPCTERQAARLATSLARDARIAERKAAREAEAARLQAEAIRQAAEDAARKVTAEAERAVQELGRPRCPVRRAQGAAAVVVAGPRAGPTRPSGTDANRRGRVAG